MHILGQLFTNYPLLSGCFIGLVGIILGSFVNVVIYRLPLMLKRQWLNDCEQLTQELNDEPQGPTGTFNLALPRSQCPHCHHPLQARYNIPILSFVWLKGRCAYCQAPISLRYLLVELLGGGALLSCLWVFSFTWQGLFAAIFILALITLSGIDWQTMLLPDQITIPLLWLGLLVNSHQLFASLTQAVWGAALGYGVLWSLYWVFKWISGREGMGYGDFKLLAAIGAWLGWPALPLVVFISSALGAGFGLWQLWMKHCDRDELQIPFGPFLAIAAIAELLFSPAVNHLYWSMIQGGAG